MRSWQASNTLRANRHYQSGKKKAQFEKNPFSGYSSAWDIFPQGYKPLDTGNNPMTFACRIEYSRSIWSVFGGFKTGKPSYIDVPDKDLNCLKTIPEGYGHIHISAKIPADLGDVYYVMKDTQAIRLYYSTGSTTRQYRIVSESNDYVDSLTTSGSDSYIDWKVRAQTTTYQETINVMGSPRTYTRIMADLAQGLDIYVHFKDTTRNQVFAYPYLQSLGQATSSLYLYFDPMPGADTITRLETEGNKEFLITADSTAITEAQYEGI